MTITLRLSTGGLAFASRMRPGGMRRQQVAVSLDRQRVQLRDFPHRGAVATYDEGSVSIDGLRGSAAACRSDGRPTSANLHWDHLDLAYFVGYALWNYIAIPAVLWELPHRELSRDGSCRRIEVHLPPEIITHWIATRRRVVPRTRRGRALPGPTLVWITLDDLSLSASRP